MDIEQKRAQLRLLQKRELLKQYQSQTPTPKAPEVLDEMPEWLDSGDRSVVKNLANNDGESIKYLQGKYPDAEFTTHGSDIVARKKGESSFRKLDPSFSPISNPMGTIKDLWNDTKDLAYDGVQMAAEGAGGLIGGTSGLTVGSLPGAFAGASVGAGVGAGAASTLKEMLRKKYGLTDEMSATDIATDAGLALAMPSVLRGAGKVAGAGIKKVAPWAYSKATGLSTEALKDIAQGAGDTTNAGVTDMIRGTRQMLSDAVDARKGNLKQGFLAKRTSGQRVDIAPAIKQLDDAIAVAREKRLRSGSNLLSEEEKKLMDMKDRIWSKNYGGKIAGVHSFETTAPRSTSPGVEATFDPIMGGGVRPKNNPVNSMDLMRGNTTDSGSSFVNKTGFTPDHLSGDMDVSDAMDIKEAIKNIYVDYSDDIGGKLGKGNTISMQEERAALEQIKVLDDLIYGQDEAGQALKRQYGDLIDEAGYLNSKFKTDERAMHTLRNLRKGKNKVLKGNIEGLDQGIQEKLRRAMNEMEIHEYFDDAIEGNYIKKQADNVFGRSPLAKVGQAGGALAGYLSGGGYAGSAIGGLAGRKMGDLLTSPDAVKAITRFARKTGIETSTLMKRIENDPKLLGVIFGVGGSLKE